MASISQGPMCIKRVFYINHHRHTKKCTRDMESGISQGPSCIKRVFYTNHHRHTCDMESGICNIFYPNCMA